MALMNGKNIADGILADLERRVVSLRERGITPTLGILLIGNDQRSAAYVRRKQRAAERIGVRVRLEERVSASVTEIEGLIDAWNADPAIHGLILQLPLPDELAPFELPLIERIDPAKDVDGLHPVNFGRLLRGYEAITPATPRGVMALLNAYHVKLTGTRVTLIGFGKLVGRALATLLVNAGATLTIVTKRAKDLATATRDAEVVISAAGSANLVTAEMIRSDAVLVDVGLSDIDPPSPDGLREGKRSLVGDISDEAKAKARLASPVPGGVGPMTVAMLLTNVVEAAERFQSQNSGNGIQNSG